jgi:hypothetical protein
VHLESWTVSHAELTAQGMLDQDLLKANFPVSDLDRRSPLSTTVAPVEMSSKDHEKVVSRIHHNNTKIYRSSRYRAHT